MLRILTHAQIAPKDETNNESDGPLRYLSPPPQYDCLIGAKARSKGITNNLMSKFVNMVSAVDGEGERDGMGDACSASEREREIGEGEEGCMTRPLPPQRSDKTV